MKTRITFGRTTTETATGWKSVRIYADEKFVGELRKDTGTHWQARLEGDEPLLKELNANYDFWHFFFDDLDGETLADAKAAVKAKLGETLDALLDCECCDI